MSYSLLSTQAKPYQGRKSERKRNSLFFSVRLVSSFVVSQFIDLGWWKRNRI